MHEDHGFLLSSLSCFDVFEHYSRQETENYFSLSGLVCHSCLNISVLVCR